MCKYGRYAPKMELAVRPVCSPSAQCLIIEKPAMFVFKDMAGCKARGKDVDAGYMEILAEQGKPRKKAAGAPAPLVSAIPHTLLKTAIIVPTGLIGK